MGSKTVTSVMQIIKGVTKVVDLRFVWGLLPICEQRHYLYAVQDQGGISAKCFHVRCKFNALLHVVMMPKGKVESEKKPEAGIITCSWPDYLYIRGGAWSVANKVSFQGQDVKFG